MIDAGVRNAIFYAMFDPAAVAEGILIGVGNSGSISLGGKYDPSCGGGPLTLYGRVVSLTDGHFPAYGNSYENVADFAVSYVLLAIIIVIPG